LRTTRALRNAIEVELEVARSRWGESNVERNCLMGMRGDLMADGLLLRRLRYFNRHGAGYAEVLERVPRMRPWHVFLLAAPNVAIGRLDRSAVRGGRAGSSRPRVAVASPAY
jgi:hypothetical protein